MRRRLGPEAYARIDLPPGFKITGCVPGSRDVWVELEGSLQPNAYREDGMFPGGLSLYLPTRYDDVNAQADLVGMYVMWALHEALEFTTSVDGHRLADPHPPDEDAMWTWLRDRVGRLLSDYRRRWPAEDGSTTTRRTHERKNEEPPPG